MGNRKQSKDPNRKSEAERYENPVASRKYITETLAGLGVPLSLKQLAEVLEVEGDEQLEALRRRLRAMERDGQVVANRRGVWGLAQKMDLVRGVVQANREGFGFLLPEDRSDDLYLGARQMRKVFDGDEVLVQISGIDRRGRREGRVVEVLRRNTSHVVGRLRKTHGITHVVAENARIHHEIFVARQNRGGAKDGQYVTVEITEQPGPDSRPAGTIIEVLGDHLAPGMGIEVALRNYAIPFEWPQEVEAQTGKFPKSVSKKDKTARFDLRAKRFVTIDGEDARDFDDAVFCEPTRSGGWRLWVAIADVSHYVKTGSALDKEAAKRGNSVYFPGKVIPMLPEALSNGLCSLRPEVDRLAMVCEMNISAAGKLSKSRFFEAVIRSHARLTYSKVAALLEEPAAYEDIGVEKRLVQPLQHLYSLYHCLKKARDKRKAIDFETTETQIIFGPGRKIEKVVPVERNDAHKLIEECMLVANVATARFLEKHHIPALYRVHDGPSETKLTSLREFLGELGLGLAGGDDPSPADYQQLLSEVAQREDRQMIQTVMLRSLSQAHYQPENHGHFGLHYQAYTHFTSPIRRYPDLLTHRAIRSVIRSDQASKQVLRAEGAKPIKRGQIYPYQQSDLMQLGDQCSQTERRADDAVRDVVSWLKCEYLQECVGDSFDGLISGVTGFGLFVELQDIFADGLIHVSELDNDYYHFDPSHHRLIGERSRRMFRLGDKVRVQIARVDLEERKVDLTLIDAPRKGKKGRTKQAQALSPTRKPKNARRRRR